MSSHEFSDAEKTTLRRGAMRADASEVILKIRDQEIPQDQVTQILAHIAERRGYDLDQFVEIFVGQLAQKRQGGW